MEQLLNWMEAHDKLAGWAQTVGALLALIVAVWIPYGQARAAAIDRARLALQRATMLSLLLNDIHIWADKAVQLATLPPAEVREDRAVSEFIERLRELESQELHALSTLSIYTCRANLLRMHHRFSFDSPTVLKMTPQAIELLKRDRDGIAEELHLSRFLEEKARFKASMVAAPWIVKPLVAFLFLTSPGKRLGKWLAQLAERHHEAGMQRAAADR